MSISCNTHAPRPYRGVLHARCRIHPKLGGGDYARFVAAFAPTTADNGPFSDVAAPLSPRNISFAVSHTVPVATGAAFLCPHASTTIGSGSKQCTQQLNHKTTTNMKATRSLFPAAAMMLAVVSCGIGPKNYSQDAAGMEAWGEDMKAKFGADAWYTQLGLSYSDGTPGVTVTETDDPASLKMREWIWSNYAGWKQTSDVTLEIEDGTPAEVFMFQLDKEVSIKMVGELVEKSKTQLTAEKNIDNPRIKTVFMSAPDDGDKSRMRIDITLEPENGGTRFRFEYNLAGELESFDY